MLVAGESRPQPCIIIETSVTTHSVAGSAARGAGSANSGGFGGVGESGAGELAFLGGYLAVVGSRAGQKAHS